MPNLDRGVLRLRVEKAANARGSAAGDFDGGDLAGVGVFARDDASAQEDGEYHFARVITDV